MPNLAEVSVKLFLSSRSPILSVREPDALLSAGNSGDISWHSPMDAIKRLTMPVEGSDVQLGFRDTGQGQLRRLEIFRNILERKRNQSKVQSQLLSDHYGYLTNEMAHLVFFFILPLVHEVTINHTIIPHHSNTPP